RTGPRADRVQSCLRHGLGNRRLAAHRILTKDRIWRRPEATREGRRRDQDHVREHLYEGSVSRRSAAARGGRSLQQASHRSEVSDQPEQRTPLSQLRLAAQLTKSLALVAITMSLVGCDQLLRLKEDLRLTADST